MIAAVVLLALAAAAAPAAASPPGAVPDGAVAAASQVARVRPAAAEVLPYDGGPVLHSDRPYLVFWLPSGAGLSFDPGYMALFEQFLAGVAHDSHAQTNVYSLTGQYTDAGGPALYDSVDGGAILDTDPLPLRDPTCEEPPPPPRGEGPGWLDCVTDAQIQTELSDVAAVHHIPATLQNILFLVTPDGLGDCFGGSLPAPCSLGGVEAGGYCAYHDVVAGSDLLYAVIPYGAVAGHCQSGSPRPNGSTADPGLSDLSHEHEETITDPLGNAWIDGEGNEVGDLCLDTTAHPPVALGRTAFGRYDQVIDGERYWLQGEWSNADGGCATRARPDSLRIAAPRTIRAGAATALRTTGADPQGRLVAVSWSFGDGASGRGSRTTHVYRRPGTYPLVARATDSWGNWVYARRTTRVGAAAARRR